MRARITARFAELHHDHEETKAQLAAVAAVVPRAADTTLLDELPLAGDILPGMPADLKARLFDVFDLQILWNNPGQQATVHAEITEATLRALPGILDPGQDGYDDTIDNIPGDLAELEDLIEPPIGDTNAHDDFETGLLNDVSAWRCWRDCMLGHSAIGQADGR